MVPPGGSSRRAKRPAASVSELHSRPPLALARCTEMPARRVLDLAEYTVADTLPDPGERCIASCADSGSPSKNVVTQPAPTTNHRPRLMLARWHIRLLREAYNNNYYLRMRPILIQANIS